MTAMPEKIKTEIENNIRDMFPKHKPPFDKETEHGRQLICNMSFIGAEVMWNHLEPVIREMREALKRITNDEYLLNHDNFEDAKQALEKAKEVLGE